MTHLLVFLFFLRRPLSVNEHYIFDGIELFIPLVPSNILKKIQ
ncbi:MAG: hypothetical protein O7D30_12425 [Rickettsia endosymbiont of Ixodes persulcatus]|nr:hypothetical protein [Rickettsia endosymbiont of Ixodes persulcatus]